MWRQCKELASSSWSIKCRRRLDHSEFRCSNRNHFNNFKRPVEQHCGQMWNRNQIKRQLHKKLKYIWCQGWGVSIGFDETFDVLSKSRAQVEVGQLQWLRHEWEMRKRKWGNLRFLGAWLWRNERRAFYLKNTKWRETFYLKL